MTKDESSPSRLIGSRVMLRLSCALLPDLPTASTWTCQNTIRIFAIYSLRRPLPSGPEQKECAFSQPEGIQRSAIEFEIDNSI